MKRIALAVLVCGLCGVPTSVRAAIAATAVWEVRTTGSNNNGSCYVSGSGTDYSQQDASQLSVTDGATSGIGVTTFTSVAAGFTSAMVNNCIYLRSGTNVLVGYYQITTFNSSSSVVLDRAPDDGVGGVSGGTGEVGGAAADPEQVTAGVVAGNTCWIKSGTYNVIVNTDTAGTNAAWIQWNGYNASRADNPTGTNRPLIAAASTRANCIVSDVGFQAWRNLRCSNATADGITGNQNMIIDNVRSTGNSGDGFDDLSNSAVFMFFNSELDTNSLTGSQFNFGGVSGNVLYGSYVHDNTGAGVTKGSGDYNILDSNGGDGMSVGGEGTSGTAIISNSVSFNNTGAGSDGFSSLGVGDYVVNTSSTNNGAFGFVINASGNLIVFNFNEYNGNSSGGLSGITAGANDVTAAPSFTNAAGGDFTYLGGSPNLGAGFPQAYGSSVIGDYQVNIGVDQNDLGRITLYDTTLYDATLN